MAESDKNEIYISSSPHFSEKLSTQKIMALVILLLLPLCVYGVILFGIPALVTILVSTVSAVVFELLFQLATKQKVRIKDCSAAVTGIMLALVLPPDTPIWMTVLGSLFAIVVAKGFFGGIGQNVFNPALVGRAFLFVSFPKALSIWAAPLSAKAVEVASAASAASVSATSAASVDAVSTATILSQIKSGTAVITNQTYLDFFLGNRAGCIGESSILLILIAFILMSIIHLIDWRTPVAMIAVVAIGTFFAGGDVLIALLSGGLMFGAVFMATDYATTPVTSTGKLIFGAGCGLITFLIRQFGGYPEGVMFSILIMNILTPFLNHIIPRKYGYVKKPKAKPVTQNSKEATK